MSIVKHTIHARPAADLTEDCNRSSWLRPGGMVPTGNQKETIMTTYMKPIDFDAVPELSARDHRRMVWNVSTAVFGDYPENCPRHLQSRTYALLHYVTALQVRSHDFVDGPTPMFDYASVGDVVLANGTTVREDCERLLPGRSTFECLLHELVDEVAWDIEEDEAIIAATEKTFLNLIDNPPREAA
jgi:hypothetical protein